ncbi:MAG: carbohydrate kinase [Rubrobacteraceae bacterium]|nr:carbohydrate kinase [Rubrobacteraceae bacterium]
MIVGIDAGTSVVKAAAFSRRGQVLAVERRRVKLSNPRPDCYEQDIEETLAAVGEVVRAVARCSDEPVEAVGITGQGDGLWLVDEMGHQVRPAITWLDARANPVVEEWMESGLFETLFRRNGNAMFPGAPAPIMMALKRSEPESLERAATAGYCKDVILQRLTGARATDASDASEPFLDLEKREYNPELLRLCGLADYRHLLAPIDPAPGPLRSLNSEGAELTGLSEGTPVHNGPFDLPAAALGAGVDRVGDGLIILGTTLACQVLKDRVEISGEPGGQTLCTLQANRWLRAMPAMVGTASLDWVLAIFGVRHVELEDILAKSPPGARGVTVLPFFSASGERAPFVDPFARGQASGMSLGTTREDIVRAVCEGVAYAARHCLQTAGLEGEITICGGGVESQAWRQIFADVLQRPLKIARKPEVGARGAAMAALISAGEDFDAAGWTRPEGYVEPQREVAAFYEESFGHYLASVEAARGLWSRSPHVRIAYQEGLAPRSSHGTA